MSEVTHAESEFEFIVRDPHRDDDTYAAELSYNSHDHPIASAPSLASTSPRTRMLPPARPHDANGLRSPAMTTVSERVRKIDRALRIDSAKPPVAAADTPAALVDDDIESQVEKKSDIVSEKPVTADSKPLIESPKKPGACRKMFAVILDYRRYVTVFLFVLMIAVFAAVAFTIYKSMHKSSTASSLYVSSDTSAFYLSVNDPTISASSLKSTLESILGTDNLNVTAISASSINLLSSLSAFNVSAGVSNVESTLKSKLSNGDSSVASISALIGYDGSITYFTSSPTEAPSTSAPTSAPSTEAPTEAQSTDSPTPAPTEAPTEAATAAPTEAPTEAATEAPTDAPTEAPTTDPSETTSSP